MRGRRHNPLPAARPHADPRRRDVLAGAGRPDPAD